MKTVTLVVTGGIAAYKACEIVTKLRAQNCDVRVVMTEHACEFVTPLTFRTLSGNPVRTGLFEDYSPDLIGHLAVSDSDVFLIAPATANLIGKIAHGLADDLASTTALAVPAGTPKLVAPAMNTKMYENPAFVKNLTTLTAELGYTEIAPRRSLLACGEVGTGALADVNLIVEEVLKTLF